MSSSPITKVYTALDIGSSKVSALIAGRNEEGNLVALGTGQHASEGVKRGYVTDVERTEHAVRNAVEQAERMAGINVEQIWVGCTSGGLVSRITTVETELHGERIEQDDIDYLLGHGRDAIEPDGRMVLHAEPALYTLDGQAKVKEPKGLHADRLGVDIHVVLADGAPVRNIDMCVRAAHLDVRAVVVAPIACGLACLSEEERELGVALVELGAAVTNISLYAGGMLVGLHTIPYGASDMTDAIASAFGIRRNEAERLKCFYGSAIASPADHREMIPIKRSVAGLAGTKSDEEGGSDDRIARAELVSVIVQQLDYLLSEVSSGLKQLGFAGPRGKMVVLTGGGAELKGIADYAQGVFGQTVRIGTPLKMEGLPEAHSGPAFATLAGLVRYADQNPRDIRLMLPQKQVVHGYSSFAAFRRLWQTLKEEY
ncbi:MAG: cell division protein FtsA [Pseudomonadota bacterium]